MTTVRVPCRDSFAGVMENDVAVDARLHAFRFFIPTFQATEVPVPELSTSRDLDVDVTGPGQTFLVPCDVIEFCIPRGAKC